MASTLGRARLAVVAAVTVLLLTACVKLDVDLTIHDNETVSGTYIIAVDRALLRLTGQDADQFYDELSKDFNPSDVPEGAKVDLEKYDEGDFIGAKISVEGLPVDQLSSLDQGATGSTNNSQFSLTHQGDQYQFHATIDTSSSGDTEVSLPAQATSNAEIRVRMTFPGEVLETNGQKSGTSVTWQPKLGEAAELTATAKDSGGSSSGDSSSGTSWLVIAAIIAGVVLVAVILVAVLARRRKETAPPASTPALTPSGPPPSLGSFAPPHSADAPPPPPPHSADAPPPPPPPPPPSGGQPLPPPS